MMEFEGMVYRVLPVVKGQGAKGEWTKQEVVFELPGEYTRKACVTFWGDKAMEAAGLREGEVVSVSFNLESREHNGRWYTEARAWKFARKDGMAASYDAPAPSPAYQTPNPTFSGGYDAPAGTGGGAGGGSYGGGGGAGVDGSYGAGAGGGFSAPAPSYSAPAPTAAPAETPAGEGDDLPF